MQSEIGSDFYQAEIRQFGKPVTEKPHQFLLTGRTALDFIIKDIKVSSGFKTVYMPSYCCHTMIKPFNDNGIAAEFYNVGFKGGKYTYEVDLETQCEAVLIMQYFGYCNDSVGQTISKLKECRKIVIEDATHSWFSEVPYSSKSDYVFASFRKWTGLPCGAVAIKQEKIFTIKIPRGTNLEYIELRRQAARLKKEFIEKGSGHKGEFLRVFYQAEKLLESDYQNYGIPKDYEGAVERLDDNVIRQRRKENAGYLIEGLKKQKHIMIIIQSDKDTPLFVPIIILNGRRDKLRQHLINNDIYCPVHWPLHSLHGTLNGYLYNNGLSLVCDQRYTIKDMERIIENIKDFYGG